MQIPTVAVKHPDDPSVQMIVNVDDAAQYEPWAEPKAAPAKGGDPKPEAQDKDEATEKSGAAPKQSTGRAGRRGRK